MDINFKNETAIPKWNHYRKYLKPILEKTLTVLDRSFDVAVSVVLVTPDEIHRLNKTYRNIDRPTDVLSFEDGEVDEGVLQLGDIFINVKAVEDQAEEYRHSLKREFCFLCAHGYLHLCGFDHMTPIDEKEMFAYQEEILDGIARRHTA